MDMLHSARMKVLRIGLGVSVGDGEEDAIDGGWIGVWGRSEPIPFPNFPAEIAERGSGVVGANDGTNVPIVRSGIGGKSCANVSTSHHQTGRHVEFFLGLFQIS